MATTKVVMQLVRADALKRAVRDAPKELRGWSADAVRESTHVIADHMRRFASAHSVSGTLLTEIEARVAIRTGLTGRVMIGPDAFYWRFLEYGTIHMAARPFVRPAAERESTPYMNRFTEIGRKLERFWSRT